MVPSFDVIVKKKKDWGMKIFMYQYGKSIKIYY